MYKIKNVKNYKRSITRRNVLKMINYEFDKRNMTAIIDCQLCNCNFIDC